MPRPRKDKVDYFPHYCKHGKTMKIMESRYGDSGYVFWFKLLELLGDTDGHYYDCRKPPDMEFLQTLYRQPTGRNPAEPPLLPVEMLDTLAILEAIDPILWGKKIIWTQNFVNGLFPVYQNRGRPVPEKPLLPVEIPPIEGVATGSLGVEIPHSIVEERIVEERKNINKEASEDADSFSDENKYAAFDTPPDPEPEPSAPEINNKKLYTVADATFCDTVIAYLNERTGSDFRTKTAATIREINARVRDGYGMEDFKKAIVWCHSEWEGDEKMEQYLRPATIFSQSKFPGYVENWARKKQRLEDE